MACEREPKVRWVLSESTTIVSSAHWTLFSHSSISRFSLRVMTVTEIVVIPCPFATCSFDYSVSGTLIFVGYIVLTSPASAVFGVNLS